VNSTFVLVGASSDIAEQFAKKCREKKDTALLITKNNIEEYKEFSYLRIKDYLDDYIEIKNEIILLNNVTIIFFNGALYENRPLQHPNNHEIKLTKYINFEIPYSLCKQLNTDIKNINKFVFLSSMAAVKPRYKNYIYGQNKKKLEDKIKKLKLDSYLIIRFGKVHTKMSEGHKTPPFSLEPSDAAEILYKKLNKNKLIYASFGLYVIAILIKLTPYRILNKLGF
jgi:hypothetical protein